VQLKEALDMIKDKLALGIKANKADLDTLTEQEKQLRESIENSTKQHETELFAASLKKVLKKKARVTNLIVATVPLQEYVDAGDYACQQFTKDFGVPMTALQSKKKMDVRSRQKLFLTSVVANKFPIDEFKSSAAHESELIFGEESPGLQGKPVYPGHRRLGDRGKIKGSTTSRDDRQSQLLWTTFVQHYVDRCDQFLKVLKGAVNSVQRNVLKGRVGAGCLTILNQTEQTLKEAYSRLIVFAASGVGGRALTISGSSKFPSPSATQRTPKKKGSRFFGGKSEQPQSLRKVFTTGSTWLLSLTDAALDVLDIIKQAQDSATQAARRAVTAVAKQNPGTHAHTHTTHTHTHTHTHT
jgi:hypothetical protein